MDGRRSNADELQEDLVALTSALVAVDSVNPSLAADGPGEGEIARVVADWGRAAGLRVEVLEATPGRPSVLVRAPGRGGGGTLLLCGHLDTVGVEGMTAPHAPRLAGDRLHGRGAYDMKAGVAAALVACREAGRLGLAGDVVVAAVADEEHASLGIQEALGAVRADAAVVTEPTELEVVVAHKGFQWIEIAVTGQAAHGSRPHLGVDAIAKAGPILSGVAALDDALRARTDPLLGRGSVHASTIAGGAELSSYPARCVVTLERRTLPGETAADVEAEVAALLESARAGDRALVAEQRTLLVREPFAQDPGHTLVATVRDCAAAELGRIPAVSGAGYWADAAFIAAAGIPTVMFGPGGAGAHADEEWVSVADTATAARALMAVAQRICG